MNAVQAAAVEYIKRGWRPIPLEGKAAIGEGWQKLEFTPDMFRDGDNIGLLMVNGLTDVDCDASEALAAAPHFLPPTGTVYGRPAKRKAHWLYRTEIPKIIKYVDLVKDSNPETKREATLIEIRVGSHQSMAPPSQHPDDKQYLEWEEPWGAEATVPDDQLIRAVRLTATTAMVSRYYNPAGNRHDWGLAIAGFMRQLGINEAEAAKVFTVAAEIIGDAKVKDRLMAVSSTYGKSDEEGVKGAGALKDGMAHGELFVKTVRKIWGASDSAVSRSLIEELNRRHAVVFQQSGDIVVITEDRDTDGRHFLRFSSPAQFRDLYPQPVVVGHHAKGAPKMKPLGAAWFDHPARRFYEGIELAPNGRANPKYYNLWRGFTVEPKKGDWSLYKRHVHEVICHGDPELTKYVVAWLANTVQKPGHQAETAIALRGREGTGKGVFARTFGELFGVHFIHLDSTRHLTGNFNAHLHNAIVVFADEAAWPGDKAGLGALKRLVTEPTLSIERKGMDIFTVPNVIHMIMASNEEWVVPAGPEARRFVVVDVADTRADDYDYFEAINEQMKNGGLAAMLYDLLDHKIDINLKRIPQTDALWEQKVHTMSQHPEQAWWFEVLNTRDDMWRDAPRYGDWYCLDRAELFRSYNEVLNQLGDKRKGTQTKMGMQITKLVPEFNREIRINQKRYYGVSSLEKCREFFETKFRSKIDWQEGDTDNERDPPPPKDSDIPF